MLPKTWTCETLGANRKKEGSRPLAEKFRRVRIQRFEFTQQQPDVCAAGQQRLLLLDYGYRFR